ncbi:MAG: M20/M25/M40 family metallo-hydrolase, partial [Limisphaerales bacterium]
MESQLSLYDTPLYLPINPILYITFSFNPLASFALFRHNRPDPGMRIIHSHQVDPMPADSISSALEPILASISEDQLRDWVRIVAQPRHFSAEKKENVELANWLTHIFRYLGYTVERQGPSANIVASTSNLFAKTILLGAHYDSAPNSPGADDNASAVAAMLSCAAALARHTPSLPVMFVAFNREEDGFLGSREFVAQFHPSVRFDCAHILEMVGFASTAPGSQRLPTGLPIQLRDTGDFLGLLSNEQSAAAMQLVLQQSRTATPDLPVTGLQVSPGAERVFPVLARSDHVPFWHENIPALMWTDTAEFRNPHYHLPSDTPETLDYTFLHRVTTLLTATIFQQAS